MDLQNKILVSGLLICTAALSWSQFGTSIGVGMIALAWVIGLFKGELKAPENRLLFAGLVGGFMWCVVGLIWSENIPEGLASLNIKLPLIIFPLAVLSITWEHKKWSGILSKIFVYSTMLAATAGLINGCVVLLNGGDASISDWSPFISHIRMGLFLALGWGILLLNRSFIPAVVYGAIAFTSVWFTESVTGVGMLIFAGLFSAISISIPKHRTRAVVGSIALALICLVSLLYLLLPTPFSGTLTEVTPWGGVYEHNPEKHLEENGHKVWNFLAIEEMRPEWNLKSDIPFNALDAKGHQIKYTLIRYLTSKGLAKDGATVKAMSEEDVLRVEMGHTSVRIHSHSGLNLRMDALRFELGSFMDGADPSGNSVTMRFEAFKTGIHILQNNGISGVLLGVGTGDLPDEFELAYVESNSRLAQKFWKRTHNQYLAWWIGLGFIGFLLWMVSLYASWGYISDFSRLAWWIIALSCLAEDTLETQAGVTFAAIVLTVFSSGNKSRD